MKRILSFLLTMMMLVSCLMLPAAAEEGWQCTGCGQTNYYLFCTGCGTKKPEGKTCQACGFANEGSSTAKFCMECGTPLDQAGETEEDRQKRAFYEQAEQYEAIRNYEQARLMYMKACGYKDALKRAYDIGYEHLNMGRLDGGLWFSVGMMADGEVKVAGRSRDVNEKIDTAGFENLKAIAGGTYHILGLKKDGTVIASGTDSAGFANAKDVYAWKNIVSVAGGVTHSAAIDEKGRAFACGVNEYGECDVSDWTDIVKIGCGASFTVGLKRDGTVIATGSNAYGQCNVSDWYDIVDISVGYRFVLGLKKDGTVVAAGSNENKQCNVSGWSNIKQISAGAYHSVALRNDGTVTATGDYTYGQLKVSDWKNVVMIHADGYHTLGVLDTGKLVHIGRSDYGQRSVSKWDLW